MLIKCLARLCAVLLLQDREPTCSSLSLSKISEPVTVVHKYSKAGDDTRVKKPTDWGIATDGFPCQCVTSRIIGVDFQSLFRGHRTFFRIDKL